MAITDVNFPQAVAKIRQQNPQISPDDWRVTYNTHLQTGLTLDDMNWQVIGLAKPTEQEMMDAQALWDATDAIALINEANWKQTRDSIRLMASTAVQYTIEIGICFEAIKNAQFPPTLDDAATFTAMITALNDVNILGGFRNVVRDSFEAQSGITLDFSNVTGVTASQQQRFNAFCDYFFTSWALMVFIGRGGI